MADTFRLTSLEIFIKIACVYLIFLEIGFQSRKEIWNDCSYESIKHELRTDITWCYRNADINGCFIDTSPA